MIGQRLPDFHDETEAIPNGAYWRDTVSTWAIRTPNGRIGSIAKHTVDEHADGTITVSPSILVYETPGRTYGPDEREKLISNYGQAQVEEWERGKPAYHGYLEAGVWRSC